MKVLSKNIGLLDSNFGLLDKNVPLVYNDIRFVEHVQDTIVFTDSQMLKHPLYTVPQKIAWLVEPPSISPWSHEWIKSNYHHFEYVVTHIKNSIIPNAVYVPFGGSWINDKNVRHKSKNVSMIIDGKKSVI